MKKILSNVLFIILLILCICSVSYVLQDKNSVNKNKDFFTEKNQFDVLFFGSSHMELFVSPMELWRDYGIASYNFGSPEQGLPVTYWVIKNAIDYNKPKIIVVDMHMFNLEGNYSDSEYLHYGLDPFPLTNTKLDAIKEMTNSKEELLEMIFKIGKYHENWKNIAESSFRDTDYYMMGNMSYGYYNTMKVTPFEQYPLTNDITKISKTSESYIYTKKIIDLCKEEGIELLFVSTPFLCDSNHQMNIHAVEKIANENEVPYINFIDMNFIIDMQTDMYDEGHVNQSGMHKVTKFLGSYIKSNYDVVDHRENESYKIWNQYYKDYKNLKYESIWQQDELDTILMMLHDEDITSYVYFNNYFDVKQDKLINDLLQNIGRRNILYGDDDRLKSCDIQTIKRIYSDFDKYALKNNNAKGTTEEYIDSEAYNEVEKYVDEFVTNKDDNYILIVIIDNDNQEVKLIQQILTENNDYRIDTLFSGVEGKYLF